MFERATDRADVAGEALRLLGIEVACGDNVADRIRLADPGLLGVGDDDPHIPPETGLQRFGKGEDVGGGVARGAVVVGQEDDGALAVRLQGGHGGGGKAKI